MRPAHCAIQYNSRNQQLACHLILCGAHPSGALFQCFHHRLHFFVPSRPPCCLWSPFLRSAPCYAHCFGAAEWVAAVAAFRQTHFVFFFSYLPALLTLSTHSIPATLLYACKRMKPSSSAGLCELPSTYIYIAVCVCLCVSGSRAQCQLWEPPLRVLLELLGDAGRSVSYELNDTHNIHIEFR